jgi:hypothetical protein
MPVILAIGLAGAVIAAIGTENSLRTVPGL